MFARRSLIVQSLFGILLGAALLLRLGVPPGWMPVHDELGFRLVPCDGHGPVEQIPATLEHAAMDHAAMGHAGMDHAAMMPATVAHDGHGTGSGEHDHGPDQPPCVFAGLSVPLLSSDVPNLPSPPLLVAQTPDPLPLHVQPGRGLAAPPPPSTGPPSLL